MASDYCTLNELQVELGIATSDTDRVGSLELAITAASREIDRWCGRVFWQDATVVTREVWPESAVCVDLLEQHGLSREISTTDGLIVKTDTDGDGTYETTLTINTDFILLPRNAVADSLPFSELWAVGSGSFPLLSNGRAGVQITAKFGWPAIPDDVKKACLLQAAQLFKSKDAVFGAAALPGDVGAVFLRSQLHPQAKALLMDYQRPVIG